MVTAYCSSTFTRRLNRENNKMTNPFKDQERFMLACDQTAGNFNQKQYNLYRDLISEESSELNAAVAQGDQIEQLDALIDILVVTIGAIHSMGADAEGAWNEVMRTNFAKIDPVTSKVRKREDGKVLKPEGWTSPDLRPFV
jgi:predicted HAD superfamily Cof-like phosphohydrolase